MASRMYSDYFGIKENAFSITPDPRFLYMSERHCEALAHLLYGVVESGCFVLLTGEVGTGKTTVCRAMLEQLPDNIDVALLLNPPQSGRELLLAISDELNVAISQRDVTLHELVYHLTRRLLENHANGRRTVVIIDEAQNISVDVLEQVRLLTNLETSTDKLLHVILVGQPELREQLEKPSLRQVSQRITARYHLEPLDASETKDYVHHRLAVAGCRQGLFSSCALRQLHIESRGIPRIINILCDRALLSAFANDLPQVCKQQIRQAATEWKNRIKPAMKLQWHHGALPLTALLLLSAAALVSAYSEELHNAFASGDEREMVTSLPANVTPPPVTVSDEPVTHTSEPVSTPEDLQSKADAPVFSPAQEITLNQGVVIPEVGSEIVQFIVPGSPPEAVRWLRDQLDNMEGVVSLEENPVFDEQFRHRLMVFQQRHGLVVDGIAGPKTLMCLNGMTDISMSCSTKTQPQT